MKLGGRHLRRTYYAQRPMTPVTPLQHKTGTPAFAVIDELLQATDVVEYQIRGAETMQVRCADGTRSEMPSPFETEREFLDAIRWYAVSGGDYRRRFDALVPVLEMWVNKHWILHAEAYVTETPNAVFRRDPGMLTLGELAVGDSRLVALLREAIAGKRRHNLVVASGREEDAIGLCRALIGEVPPEERIDTIEDAPVLRFSAFDVHGNTYERYTRQPNNDGYGEFDAARHIRDAKTANTDKLVVRTSAFLNEPPVEKNP